jgi:hypothetical protein
MENLFKLLKAIYGENVVARTIGSRTNVIKLPSVKNNPTMKAFDMEAAAADGPKKIQLAKDAIEEQIPYISKMNDSERLMFEGNVKRLHDVVNPPSAEVVQLSTKQPVTGEGLLSLTKEAGQINAPGTMVGNIESKVNKLKSLGKELEKATGEKQTLGGILGDVAKSQMSYEAMHKEGLVRATAREIIEQDLKAGKLKTLTKEELNSVDPIDIYRRHYGEGALEQVDSLLKDISKTKSPGEAAELVKSKYTIEPKATPSREYLTDEEVKGLDYLTGQGPEKKAKGGILKKKYGHEGIANKDKAQTTVIYGEGSLPKEYQERKKYGLGSIASDLVNGLAFKVTGQQGTFSGFQNLINQLVNQGVISPVSNEQTTQPDPSMSLKDQYLNRLSQIQSPGSSGTSYSDFKNLLQSKLERKAEGGSVGLDYLTGK